MLSLLRLGFFKGEETWAVLKCEGKDPSEGDKFTLSLSLIPECQWSFFTKLVGIDSKAAPPYVRMRKKNGSRSVK